MTVVTRVTVTDVIIEAGAYRLSTAAGYSAEMVAASVEDFRFPDGHYWSTAVGPQAPQAELAHDGGDVG